MSLKVLCDFDGTVTRADTADAVFTAFAKPAWHDIESLWAAGEIGSAECMRRQMELVDASVSELDALLDGIEIDPSFILFTAFCEAAGIEVDVVSDGVDYFIQRILRRHGLGRLPVRANRLRIVGHRSYSLEHPYRIKDCASGAGTCKCACNAAAKKGHRTILIGDGRSDFCAAQEADLVFAKKSLLTHTREQGIPSIAFSAFDDITALLERIVSQPALSAVSLEYRPSLRNRDCHSRLEWNSTSHPIQRSDTWSSAVAGMTTRVSV